MLSDTAKILGLPPSLVKNWTIGRPLTLNPSVAAHGTGSRNMYSMGDLHRIAIAAQMNADGLAPVVIQAVLDELENAVLAGSFAVVRNTIAGHAAWSHASRPHVEIVSPSATAGKGRSGFTALLRGSPACYLLDLEHIAGTVNDLAASFLSHARQQNRRSKSSVSPPPTKPVRKAREVDSPAKESAEFSPKRRFKLSEAAEPD